MRRQTASAVFELCWESGLARHTDITCTDSLNLWRDYLPPGLEALAESGPGTRLETRLPKEEPVPPRSRDRVVSVAPEQFDRHFRRGMTIEPRLGRFYPVGILQRLPGYSRGDRMPCRCVALEEKRLRFDLNHPLAGRDLRLAGELVARHDGGGPERGGLARDWALEAASGGPGMQALEPDLEVDFRSDDPFARLDEEPDERFYAIPRLVHHLDDTALARLSAFHGRMLRPGGRVLDLMSSWTSHLPGTLALERLTGLGMNREELEANPRLDERLVHDLNADPRLPFADESFDAVLCALSVEYLVRPRELFREVRRVLRPGGAFLVTFSNRWFPGKAIQLWPQLHEFERMGLVLAWFRDAGGFGELETWSLRGLPRPGDDKYSARLGASDPLFAVWGRRTGEAV